MTVRARERGRDTPVVVHTLRWGGREVLLSSIETMKDEGLFAIAVAVAYDGCSRDRSVVWGQYVWPIGPLCGDGGGGARGAS